MPSARATLLFLFLIGLLWGPLAAQEIILRGKVRDVNTHREISSVSIYVLETGEGATSDFAGRFRLGVANPRPDMTVVFQHVAFDTLRVTLEELKRMENVDLQERVFELEAIETEAESEKLDVDKDLPQTVEVIEAQDFEMRGYVDAGDLLRTDHSVQVEEALSGKKTVAIRGGNSDEVVVMFNGIKMNSSYNNEFDMSLVDLEDIDRFEVIKGSNTALYGSEAFSGVINIVPRAQQDYTVRFYQRFGTYDYGNWGAHLYRGFGPLHANYSIKQGGSTREFAAGENGGNAFVPALTNASTHHTGNLNYHFSEAEDGRPITSLGFMLVRTEQEYENERDDESVLNFNQLLSGRFSGHIGPVRDLSLTSSVRWLNEEQDFVVGSTLLERDIIDRSIHINAEKAFTVDRLELLFGYQFQNAELDYLDDRGNLNEVQVGLESALLHRNHHGLVGIFKYHGPSKSDYVKSIDISASFRYDHVEDTQDEARLRVGPDGAAQDSAGFFGNNTWDETMLKLSMNLEGFRNDFKFNGFINFGSNVKFPTLFQQVSSPAVIDTGVAAPNLAPEENRSLEIGLAVSRELRSPGVVYGWRIGGSVFDNYYNNKFRIFQNAGSPINFYDNVAEARLTGLETKGSAFLFRKKITLEFGFSRYFIEEKAVFPFKYDVKRIMNVIVEHAGYSFQMHWFKEGEQIALIRQPALNNFEEITLPDYTNLDLHIGKTFEIKKLRLIANFSVRNLLKDDFELLEGLALRDRRFYVTMGFEY